MTQTPLEEARDPQTPPARLEELAKKNRRLALAVAENPKTPPQLLAELSDEEYHYQVRAAVARHPNTPLPNLSWLATRFPGEFLQNPVLPLLLLENPNFFQTLPWGALDSLLRHKDAPLHLLEWGASQQSSHALTVAENPSAPPALVQKILEGEEKNTYYLTRRRIARHPALPARFLEQFARDSDLEVRSLVASHANTPAKALETLARDTSPSVRAAVAANKNTPPDLLWKICKDPEVDALRGTWKLSTRLEVLLGVARHPSAPPDLLRWLAESKAPKELRMSIARHPNTPHAILAQYTKERHKEVPQSVLQNPNVSPEILALLAERKEEDLMPGIARHPRTPPETLRKLARDGNYSTCKAVAQNPNAPPDLLEALLTHPHPDFRKAASQNPRVPRAFLDLLLRAGCRPDFSDYAVPNLDPDAAPPLDQKELHSPDPSLPAEELESLSQRGFYGSYLAARHPNTPPQALKALAEAKEPSIRAGVAQNPNAPLEVLQTLAREENAYLRACVAKNPNAPDALRDLPSPPSAKESGAPLQALLQQDTPEARQEAAKHPDAAPSLLEALSQDEDTKTRESVAQHPNTPPSVLRRLAADKSTGVLMKVAQNPNTPLDVFALLVHDDWRWLRREARKAFRRKGPPPDETERQKELSAPPPQPERCEEP